MYSHRFQFFDAFQVFFENIFSSGPTNENPTGKGGAGYW